jgi:hypothetical protein
LQADAAVFERLLADGKTLLARFETCFLDRICLHEAVKLRLIAPAPAVVVVVHGARFGADDHGEGPAGQLQDEAGGRAAVKLGRAMNGLGEPQPPARIADGDRIANLGLHSDKMRHVSPFIGLG